MLTLTPNAAEFTGYFTSGRVGFSNGSIDAYFGLAGQFAKVAEREPDAKCDVLVPPGHDGGRGDDRPRPRLLLHAQHPRLGHRSRAGSTSCCG